MVIRDQMARDRVERAGRPVSFGAAYYGPSIATRERRLRRALWTIAVAGAVLIALAAVCTH